MSRSCECPRCKALRFVLSLFEERRLLWDEIWNEADDSDPRSERILSRIHELDYLRDKILREYEPTYARKGE